MYCWRTRILFRLYLVLFAFTLQIYGRRVNVSIDDQYGDPTTGQVIQYNPPEAWQVGQGCGPCTAKPQPASNAHNGTWMDATFFPAGDGESSVAGQILSASVPFIGTAVFVNVITTGSINFPAGNSDFTFYVDNVTEGVYQQPADGDNSYKFHQIVFSMRNLTNSLHTITIEVGRGGNKSLVLLDSIIYTKQINDDSSGNAQNNTGNSDSSGSGTNIGVIVGPVVGGVVVAGAIVGLILFLRRRRRHQGQRVKVLIDSPPMESISQSRTRPPGSSGHEPLGHIDPFITSNSHTPYSDSNQNSLYEMSSRGAPAGTGTATRSELSYGPTNFVGSSVANASSHDLTAQLRQSVSQYHDVDESVADAASPLTAPPAYSEVNSSGSSDVSRLPNPYGKGART